MNRPDGFALAEVLVALCLLVSIGVLANGAALSMTRLAADAHAEAAGLAAASGKLEELVATGRVSRESGNDEVDMGGVSLIRVWRVRRDDPTYGLDRLEVTARWTRPAATLLTLATVSP